MKLCELCGQKVILCDCEEEDVYGFLLVFDHNKNCIYCGDNLDNRDSKCEQCGPWKQE